MLIQPLENVAHDVRRDQGRGVGCAREVEENFTDIDVLIPARNRVRDQ